MVCKECGAYNAEHLTHCRVCAAKLRDNDTAASEPAPTEQEAPARPARNFAQAPQWPARAYAGASEPQPVAETPAPAAKPVAPRATAPAAAAETATPAAKPAAPAARPATPAARPAAPVAQEEKRFCTACGKPLLADALFCAYCGAKNAAAQAAVPAAVRPAAAVPAQVEEEPRHAKRIAPQKQELDAFDDDEELEEDGDFSDLYEDDDDEDDEYYDDEYDDDDDDYPKGKRKGKGGTILFIVLVLVLLALIAFFGMYIVNKNYGGSFSNMISSLTGGAPASEADPEGGSGANIVSSNVTADNMSATIEETMVGDVEMVNITVSAPNDSQVRIVSTAALEKDTATITQGDSIALQVPRAVFLPGTFCDSTTVSVTPQLEITLPDGSTKMLNVPAFNVTVPQVTLALTEPAGETVEATADGSPIKVSGTVTDHTVTVTVNGEAVQVLEGGAFSYDYTPTSEEGQTIQILAQKENYMSATQSVSVTPYVVKEMPITITSTVKDKKLTAADGKVTVEGTTAPGATVTAICENTEIVCSAVTVTETGAFTCVIEVPKEGCYEINFAAKAEGYDDSAASCIVERAPTTKSSTYKDKALNLNKNYSQVAEGKSTSTTLAVTGKVKEIIQDPNYVIFTIETSNGDLVYVCNRSEKNKIEANDIGETKTVAGFNAGLYPETTSPYIWGWYIWNK